MSNQEVFSDDQLQRYSRQLLVADFDLDGQEAIAGATVLLVGCGGLANPAALYLAGAGVGRLILVDDDTVDTSNLHRQIAFRGDQVGQGKAAALAAQLNALNPDVRVEPHAAMAGDDWLDRHLPDVDLVLVWSEDQAKALPADLDPLLVTEERLSLAELLEEELLLALPLVALHDECPRPASTGSEPEPEGDPDDTQTNPDNPFAVLARLKGRRK